MKRHLLCAADLTRDDAELVLTTADGDALAGRPADQEAARPARPHRGQPLLRGLHPHPDLLRGRRQAALAPTSSTSPPRAPRSPRASRSRTPRSPSRRWAPTPSSSATAPRGAPHRLAHSGWVRSSVVNAGDGTHEHPTQALLDAFTMWRHLGATAARRPPGRDRRRRAALAGWPAPTRCCCTPSAPRSPWSPRRRCCRSASTTWPRRDVVRPRRGDPQGRRGDDAARPARADERRRSSRPRASTPAATASTAAGWRPSRTTRSSCTPARWCAAWRSPPTWPTPPAR